MSPDLHLSNARGSLGKQGISKMSLFYFKWPARGNSRGSMKSGCVDVHEKSTLLLIKDLPHESVISVMSFKLNMT